MSVEETGTEFQPLTPVMPDEHNIDAPRQALADAKRRLQLVEDLMPLGKTALVDPPAALAKAQQIVAETQAALDGVLQRLLKHPDEPQ